jgi:hypothetical protein
LHFLGLLLKCGELSESVYLKFPQNNIKVASKKGEKISAKKIITDKN